MQFVLLFVLTLWLAITATGQNMAAGEKDSIIKDIRVKYKTIKQEITDTNLVRIQKKHCDKTAEQTNNTTHIETVTIYYKSNSIILIEDILESGEEDYGYMDKKEYYFFDNSLFFYFTSHYEWELGYITPEEPGCLEPYYEKSTTCEFRYYFHNKKIIEALAKTDSKEDALCCVAEELTTGEADTILNESEERVKFSQSDRSCF